MYYLTKTERNPWSLLDEIDSFFGAPTALSFRSRGTALEGFTPRVDVSETEKQVKISAELPGVDEKDVKVELEENILTITGEKKTEEIEEGENWYRREQSYGSFQRSIRLPETINADKVKAKFRKGILNVSVPKVKVAEPKPKQIAIES